MNIRTDVDDEDEDEDEDDDEDDDDDDEDVPCICCPGPVVGTGEQTVCWLAAARVSGGNQVATLRAAPAEKSNAVVLSALSEALSCFLKYLCCDLGHSQSTRN